MTTRNVWIGKSGQRYVEKERTEERIYLVPEYPGVYVEGECESLILSLHDFNNVCQFELVGTTDEPLDPPRVPPQPTYSLDSIRRIND